MTTATLQPGRPRQREKASTVALMVASLILALALGSGLVSTAGTRPDLIAPAESDMIIDTLSWIEAFHTETSQSQPERNNTTDTSLPDGR